MSDKEKPSPTQLIGYEDVEDNLTVGSAGWLKKMIMLYDEGRDDYEVCRELNLTIKQFEDYRAQSKKFCELVDRGRDYAKAFWLKLNRLGSQKKLDVSTDLVKWNMTNRYNWGQKSEVRATENVHVDAQKVEDELRKILPDLNERLSRGETLETMSRKILSESSSTH